MLHVHDLVDYVSEEAAAAGRNAAAYVKAAADVESEAADKSTVKPTDEKTVESGIAYAESAVPLIATSGVRYTVPSTIRVSHMDEKLTVRFRVGGVYKNCFVSVYFDDERVVHRKKQVFAPGEMEEVRLTKEQFLQYPDLAAVTFRIEEE